MTNENFKEIMTRIALRTGDYNYWINGAGKDIELIKGEVCVCTVEKSDNQAQTAPTILFKVCDTTGKKFANLDWLSAKAADVYDWAKKSETEFTTWIKTLVPVTVIDPGVDECIVITGFTTNDQTITITRRKATINDIEGLSDTVTNAGTALQEIEVGAGLTISTKENNKQTINIDPDVVFILDCNW